MPPMWGGDELVEGSAVLPTLRVARRMLRLKGGDCHFSVEGRYPVSTLPVCHLRAYRCQCRRVPF